MHGTSRNTSGRSMSGFVVSMSSVAVSKSVAAVEEV